MGRVEKYNIEKNGIKFIVSEIIKFKWYSIILPFMACIAQISLSLVLIIMPKVVLDAVENKDSIECLSMKILLLGTIFVVTSILNMRFHNAIKMCSQEFLYKRMTVLWIEKAISMDYNVLISNKGKILLEKARQAISSPNWGIVEFLSKFTDVLETFVGLLVYCIIVGKLHICIVLLLILFFVIELLTGFKVEKKKQALKDDRAKATRRINYIAYRTRGMQEGKDIRVFSMSALLKQISHWVINDKRNIEEKAEKLMVCHFSVTAFLILLRDGFAYIYLCYLFIQGKLSIGDFTFYFATIAGIGNWLTKLSDSISSYIEINNFVKDFTEFMELADSEEGEKVAVDIETPIEIEFKDVSFSYRTMVDNDEKEINVLDKLNVKINKGEKVAIVGVNGAGKSTFVKLLCGILRPSKGHIYINGIDSSSIPRKEYFNLFAVVFQSSQVLPISIADNIMLNMAENRDGKKMWKCVQLAGLQEKIESLPKKENTCLVKGISEEGIELSGGQVQRLFLARALYKDAPFLILDEPTAALDPIAENDIYQKYNTLTENGKTSVFISHRLASTRFCDKIMLMENGNILECGTHEELMQLNGKYAEMFEIQSKYYKGEADGGIDI